MKNLTYKITAILCAASISFCSIPAGFVYAQEETYEEDSISVDTTIKSINKEGDIILNITTEELRNKGFSVGDEVKIVIDAYDYSKKMPFVVTDSDSLTDEEALINEDDYAALSVAKGNFAEDSGLFTSHFALFSRKTIWKDINKNNGIGTAVKIYLHEKGEYKEQYEMRNPERTYDRDDYSSDAKYANFRNVTAGTIKPDILFRSSSPINDDLNRADYAREKMEKYGIKAVLNLSDDEKKAKKYIEKSGNDYYKKLFDEGNVICLALSYDFDSDEFGHGIAQAVKFMATHDGPYLVHCTEGKDRTGFLCALLESLLGASVSEMTSDYMQTYKNFYHYNSDSKEFKYTKKNYLNEIFMDIADADTRSELKTIDYHQAAVDFLTVNGVTEAEIENVVNKLKETDTAYDEILELSLDDSSVDEKGRLELGLQDKAIATYTGEAIKPGAKTMQINDTYMYRGRDYKVSYSDNKHAGTMTLKIKFKKKTEIYQSGIKKATISYTIKPKEATSTNIEVKLNKKGTKIKSVKDLDRNAKIKSSNYSYDMSSRVVNFFGDYTGSVSF
ncbi:MAG: tyrosine-protein phosphatase [Lachnospiraceae bacterium]|nr:tyrosine-protein phosphatase [Lachnospiraceae bacterium]